MGRMVFITNNPDFAWLVHPKLETVFLEHGSSLDVLTMARDRVHLGWRLLHHPLYGNIRPHLQPFRSALLSLPKNRDENGAPGTVDPYSLDLIANAVAIYEEEKDRLSFPWSVPISMRADCAFLDQELMRETLAFAGLPSRSLASTREARTEPLKPAASRGEEGTP